MAREFHKELAIASPKDTCPPARRGFHRVGYPPARAINGLSGTRIEYVHHRQKTRIEPGSHQQLLAVPGSAHNVMIEHERIFVGIPGTITRRRVLEAAAH